MESDSNETLKIIMEEKMTIIEKNIWRKNFREKGQEKIKRKNT